MSKANYTPRNVVASSSYKFDFLLLFSRSAFTFAQVLGFVALVLPLLLAQPSDLGCSLSIGRVAPSGPLLVAFSKVNLGRIHFFNCRSPCSWAILLLVVTCQDLVGI